MRDSKGSVPDPRSFWAGDVLELFIDTRDKKTPRTYEAGDHQFWLAPQIEQKRAYVGQWKRGEEIAETQLRHRRHPERSRRRRAGCQISFDDLKTAAVLKERDVWELVAQNVESGHMPPKRKPSPKRAQRDRLVEWIQTTLSAVDCNIKDPGHVTLHRLNRDEYNNTIRDLMGVDFKPAADFPSDDVGDGFDNIGDVLSISPLADGKIFQRRRANHRKSHCRS